MSHKIFGIIVCILLLSSYVTIAETLEKTSGNSLSKKLFNSPLNAEVPTWEVNDKWNYKIENMTIDYEESGQYVHVNLETNKLELNVIEVTVDSYVVKIDAAVSGSGNVYFDMGDGPINISITLKNTQLSGTVVFNKSDIGIKQINPRLDGRIWLSIIEQPYLQTELPAVIPIHATIDLSLIDSTNPLPIINFPLDIGSIWGLPSTNISIDGTIKSPYLNLIHFFNNIARIPIVWSGLMLIAQSKGIDNETAKMVSDIIKDVLPVVDISYVLQQYMKIGNTFETPEIPTIMGCGSIEDIVVQGNTYNVYNITVGYVGNIYYSQSAGNIVKISGHFKDIIPFVSDLNIDLVETNYQP